MYKNDPKMLTSQKLSGSSGLLGLKMSYHSVIILWEMKPISYLAFYLVIKF